jgi:hypothetical protein
LEISRQYCYTILERHTQVRYLFYQNETGSHLIGYKVSLLPLQLRNKVPKTGFETYPLFPDKTSC